MASTSFLLSSHTIGRRPSAIPPPPIVRISAGIATLARGNQKAYQNSSLYELLGVQSSATFKEIKSAYRKLAKVLHPDVAAHDHGQGYRASSEDFRRVNAAYATLSDPEKRAVYDSLLFRRGHMVSSASYYPMVTRPWRNWETDQCW